MWDHRQEVSMPVALGDAPRQGQVGPAQQGQTIHLPAITMLSTRILPGGDEGLGDMRATQSTGGVAGDLCLKLRGQYPSGSSEADAPPPPLPHTHKSQHSLQEGTSRRQGHPQGDDEGPLLKAREGRGLRGAPQGREGGDERRRAAGALRRGVCHHTGPGGTSWPPGRDRVNKGEPIEALRAEGPAMPRFLILARHGET